MIAEASSRAVGLGLLWLVVSAIPAGAETWTVERVLDAARRRGSTIRAATAAGDAGRAEASVAFSSLSPRIGVRGGLLRTDDPASLFAQKMQQGRLAPSDLEIEALNQPPPATSIHLGIMLEQPVFNGGREIFAPSMAGHLRRAAEHQLRAAIAGELLDAVAVFTDATRARGRFEADSLGLVAAEEAARAVGQRYRAGQVSELDTLRAAARRAQASVAVMDARRRLEWTCGRLSRVVGEPVQPADIAIVDAIPTAPLAIEGAERPEVEAARSHAAAAALASRQAGLSLLPSVNAMAGFDHFRDWDQATFERRWSAGVTLDLPIWDGRQRLREWHSAQARARETLARTEALERDLAVDTRDAQAALAQAAERVAASRLGERAAVAGLHLALDRYRSGLLPFGEWLEASADAERARALRTDAESEAVLSYYRFLHATGALQ